MKKNLFVMMALIASLAILAGCGDDDSPAKPGGGDDPQVETGTITFTFDGENLDYSENSVGTDEDPGWYVFVGQGSDPSQTMTVRLPSTEGTYDMGDNGEPSIAFVHGNLAWFIINGTMTITTASDDNIEGTFSGTYENLSGNTQELTAGYFDVPVTRMP